jgi:phosphatidylethanolamine/phosphatidyl-N-methylethanolamine N-methyltransferase
VGEMSEADFCGGLYGELQGEGAHGWYVRRAHEALEVGLGEMLATTRILEVGGNLGEHCPYVTHPYASYLVTDYRDTGFASADPRISFEVADVENLPYPDDAFDRVVMTCLLHHLVNPEKALRETRRVVGREGVISIQLPCDPGLAYRASKVVGPYRLLKKQGHQDDPRYFHYHQHRNHFPGIVSIINRVFARDDIRRKWWPLLFPTWNANLFTVYQVKVNKGDL